MIEEKEIETLTEFEAENSYEEVKDIRVLLKKNKIIIEISKNESIEIGFKELLDEGIPEFEDIYMEDYYEKELYELQDDLEKYWNNTGRKFYKLEYNYMKDELPYRIYLPFTTDLIDNKTILETHDEDGNIINEDILSKMDEDTQKLETYNLYGDLRGSYGLYGKIQLTTYDWYLYDAQISEGYYERYKNVLEKIKHNNKSNISIKEMVEGVIYWIILLIASSIVPILKSISFLSWFIIWMVFGPPWTQHLMTIKIYKGLKYRIKAIYEVVTEKQYKFNKFLEVAE